MASAISSATSTATAAKETNSTALTKLDGDFQSFLKLLTVQLQNQDPTEPLDTNQLTDQITQFSQVEQQINTNKSLQKLIDSQNTSAINSAVSYIDRFVEYEGTDFYQRQGGAPLLSYKLPEEAKSVTVSITSDTGKVIYSKDLTADGGTTPNVAHAIKWDGKDASGNPVATGKYKVNVVAKNKSDGDITAITKVTDMVTEVALESGEVQLTLGTIKVPASKVLAIKGTYAEVNGGTTGTNGTTGS